MIRLTDTKGNWDIYLNERGYTESIAIVEGCGNSVYGSMSHFIKNLSLGYIDLDHLTDEGREIAIKEANARKYKIKGLNI